MRKEEIKNVLEEHKHRFKRIGVLNCIGGYSLFIEDTFKAISYNSVYINASGEGWNTNLNINWRNVKSLNTDSERLVLRLTNNTDIFFYFLRGV